MLGERSKCLKVFVHADMANRVERCVDEYHIPSDDTIEECYITKDTVEKGSDPVVWHKNEQRKRLDAAM